MVNSFGTIQFKEMPSIASTGVVVGPVEKESPFASSFDEILSLENEKGETFEQANTRFIEKACTKAVQKGHEQMENIDVFIGGDLVNQLSPTNFAARQLAIPFLGVFSACASSMESIILGSLLLESGNAKSVLAGASSHHPTVERQFRYPLEYGSQKPGSCTVDSDSSRLCTTTKTCKKCANYYACDDWKSSGWWTNESFTYGSSNGTCG